MLVFLWAAIMIKIIYDYSVTLFGVCNVTA